MPEKSGNIALASTPRFSQKKGIRLKFHYLLVALVSLLATSCSEAQSKNASEDVIQQTGQVSTYLPGTPEYVGRKTCQSCHAEEDALWQGSHHDLAMEEATAETVLGDFNDASFTIDGRTSTFTKKDGKYFVKTEDKDGKLGQFQIKYTFGVIPLQQYLIEFPDGRMQTLGIAWDSRPAEQGGERWFHLYPRNTPPPGDALHWSGIDQTWNYQCAECHSTNLKKGYDSKTDRYQTTWSEIDVSCEACHGPASNHLLWAEKPEGWEEVADKGLVVNFDERKNVAWTLDAESGTARRNKPLSEERKEQNVCARCHSRRGILSEEYQYGKPLLDTHRLSLLTADLYYPDGQILDEVYVHGSFLQSKMYHAGVTCSDCHETHSLKLRAEGNGVCLQCHAGEKFNVPDHHKHEMDTPGASCVECHMPETNYMVIDPRRDHSMRIPRPDLSVSLGVPNACNRCHSVQTNEWAVEQMKAWYGEIRNDWQNFSLILEAARQGNPAALPALEKLVGSKQMPAIIRATLLLEYERYLSPSSLQFLVDALYEEDPLIRLSAIRILTSIDPGFRVQLLMPILDDPVRAVRLEATRQLVDVPRSRLNSKQMEKLSRAFEEYEASLQVNADRPEALSQLGVFYAAQGRQDEAKQVYQRAIELDKQFSGAYLNQADLLSGNNQEAEAMKLLKQGMAVLPNDPNLHYALGLSYVRAKRYEEALPVLAEAAKLAPENARYPYVYAIALHSTGNMDKAIGTLEQALLRHPYDREITGALVTYYRESGDTAKATEMAERLK
jgi:tetratricopeptide (TPR) repeat protein